jgi:hypothetical protein
MVAYNAIPMGKKIHARTHARTHAINFRLLLGTALPGKPQLLHMWVTKPLDDLNSISPCDHEEADTRVILHAAQAYHHNHQTIMIRTVDTDVVVSAILVAFLGRFSDQCNLVFHALTGCDTVSGFAGRGKKTAWSTWRSFPDLADVLLQLTTDSNDLPESSLDTIERFVILLYDRTNTFSQLDEARRKLFLHRRSPLRLPPTSGAIRQHVKSTSRWLHMAKLFEPHTRHY